MKPFGYYGLNLDISTEIAIDNLQLHELTDLLNDLTFDLNNTHYLENDEVIGIAPQTKESTHDLLGQSDLGKLGAIRGLCDRIEQKLMEQAN
ncbi:hypothetical protein H6F42_15875 [Pseudanabaena sp. FACHB-1998]|uniref:hypothetical protein n=1 Tax=Pseudanabaena sp. FACHB-1998 TaxID=2692858 RepID=UPI0016815FAF|nr:hypothetical protein [Pseudanabaena sp. FACHB-1998]MBD2178398.1 hypothetical protein [Pseudanabaena sp. FACHB-1998]